MAKSNTNTNIAYLRPHNLNQVPKEQGYRWVERDGDMEVICNEITRQGLTAGQLTNRIYKLSDGHVNLHYQTVERWMDGKTKRPQHFNLAWAARALGFTWTLIHIPHSKRDLQKLDRGR